MNPSLKETLEELRSIEDRDLRFDLLIEYADRFQEVPPSVATRPYPEAQKAPACESEAYAWVVPDGKGNAAVHFAVENPQGISAKALAVILSESLSGRPLAEISALSEDIVYDIFGSSISMGKGQGLMGMIRIVKELSFRLLSRPPA